MSIHLLYFRLSGAERFADIHGGAIAKAVRDDLGRRFGALSRVLLAQHDVLSGPVVPQFGVWAVPFGTKRLEIAADEREQLDSIAAAGRDLGLEAVAEELGAAVALNTALDVGTLAVEGREGSARRMSRLASFLRRNPPSRPAATEAERGAIRRIVRGGFELRLQEIVSLGTRRGDSCEALIRGPEGPLYGPERLFAEAARCGLRDELELASLDAALKVAPLLPSPLRLSVNLSPGLFAAPALRRLAQQPRLAGRLILEITEHHPIPDAGRLLRALAPLRRRGAKIALDDAGCGYLNMELVRALRPDVV
ncbi:MAG: EAL domain-containing protein, partial [Elusimicrobia bacterium]|nr:EAL domain-containing protein [Elusimicrobiota bacterium]